MKRFMTGLICCFMAVGVVGCGGNTQITSGSSSKSEVQSTEPETESQSKELSKSIEELVSVDIGEILEVVGNNERRFITVNNISNQFLNGILKIKIEGNDGSSLDTQTIFFMNNQPNGTERELIMTPIGSEIKNTNIEVVRMEASDKPKQSPEITKDNIYEYIYLKYIPIKDIRYGEAIFNGDLCNLTTQYFSGEVVYKIKDSNGEELLEVYKTYENISPGTEEPIVDGVKPSEGYNVDYEIVSFRFTDEPM